MTSNQYDEGVKPGGLTTTTEIRILICYILDCVDAPVSRAQFEEVLLGEALVNYFAMAESFAQLLGQGLVTGGDDGYRITEKGRTVGRTLAHDVPFSVRETAVRGVIRAQQYAARAAVHRSEVVKTGQNRTVQCAIGDDAGPLFRMELYMPDDLSAESVRDSFVENGDEVYKLVLAALTGNRALAEKALAALDERSEDG